jgi:predicted outer membrane repeat protein
LTEVLEQAIIKLTWCGFSAFISRKRNYVRTMDRAIIKYLILLVLVNNLALGVTRRVPADYSTIQAAIDDCNDGDVVLVAPGTYAGDGNRDIDFKGKAITVKSECGSNTCIINCQGSPNEYHRGFYFHNDEDANSVAQGFTIINGYAARGGGIFCESASPHILDCLITENTAIESGGGIHCEYSNPTITRCFIEKNSANYGGGVGIGTTGNISSMLTMTNCLITGNKAMRSGGGICCIGKVNFSNCTVFGNSADIEGGGISFLLVVGEKIKNSILYGNM